MDDPLSLLCFDSSTFFFQAGYNPKSFTLIYHSECVVWKANTIQFMVCRYDGMVCSLVRMSGSSASGSKPLRSEIRSGHSGKPRKNEGAKRCMPGTKIAAPRVEKRGYQQARFSPWRPPIMYRASTTRIEGFTGEGMKVFRSVHDRGGRH